MKKIGLSFLLLTILTGVGTAVYASDSGFVDFKDRLPFMQERHPDLTEDQLEERFQSCRYNRDAQFGNMNRFSEERDGEWGNFNEDRPRWGGQGQGHGRGHGMMRFNNR